MKKLLSVTLLWIFLLNILLGCANSKSHETVSGEAFLVEASELHVKQGTASTELPLSALMQLPSGETVNATLNLKNADLFAPGEYEIAYQYDSYTVFSKIFVYGNVRLFRKGAPICDSSVTVSYREAASSRNFLSAVTAQDSFGNDLPLSVSADSEAFADLYGSYDVTYLAADRCGNHLAQSVTVTVTDEACDGSEQLSSIIAVANAKIKNDPYCSIWKPVSNGYEATAFSHAFYYAKKDSVGAVDAALTIENQGMIKLLTFDVFVSSATGGYLDMGVQGGARIREVTDANDQELPITGVTAYPTVRLTQGAVYTVQLNLKNAGGNALLCVSADKSVQLYFSNFNFVKNEDPSYLSQSTIFYSDSQFGYFAWPSVERLDGDRLIAVSSGYRAGHIDPYGKVVGWISEDAGESWGEPFVIADTVLDDRDPSVIYWKDTVIVTWFTKVYSDAQWADYYQNLSDEDIATWYGFFCSVSPDGGVTWSEPTRIPVFSPHGIIEAPSGDLVYVGYSEDWAQICMVTSRDGMTWSEPTVIATAAEKKAYGFEEPHAVFAQNGVMIVQLRTASGIYQCESQKLGEAFGEFHLVCNAKDTPPHLLRLKNGTLLMTYGYRAYPYGIRARISHDNGITWGKEITVTADAVSADSGYADTLELEDGRLLTVSYQRRIYSEVNTAIVQVIWRFP